MSPFSSSAMHIVEATTRRRSVVDAIVHRRAVQSIIDKGVDTPTSVVPAPRSARTRRLSDDPDVMAIQSRTSAGAARSPQPAASSAWSGGAGRAVELPRSGYSSQISPAPSRQTGRQSRDSVDESFCSTPESGESGNNLAFAIHNRHRRSSTFELGVKVSSDGCSSQPLCRPFGAICIDEVKRVDSSMAPRMSAPSAARPGLLARVHAKLAGNSPSNASVATSGGKGILVHGCHLQAEGWERIVWGEAPFKLGRLPHAVLLAWEEKASVVVFGTGASQRGGLKESEVTLQYLWDHWHELADFEALHQLPLNEVRAFMNTVAVLDRETQNTDQEISNALRIMSQKQCRSAILVSSPTHLPRCLASACKLVAQDAIFNGFISASPCDTCYQGANASDVVVVEPPHRGDRDKSLDRFKFHHMVRRMCFMKAEDKATFLPQVELLLGDFGA